MNILFGFVARMPCKRLSALAQESDAPINVLLSSPGDYVESVDVIHDLTRDVKPFIRLAP